MRADDMQADRAAGVERSESVCLFGPVCLWRQTGRSWEDQRTNRKDKEKCEWQVIFLIPHLNLQEVVKQQIVTGWCVGSRDKKGVVSFLPSLIGKLYWLLAEYEWKDGETSLKDLSPCEIPVQIPGGGMWRANRERGMLEKKLNQTIVEKE